MKRSLGRVLVLWCWFSVAVWAAPYEWQVTVADPKPYMHEGIVLEYVCRFSDGGGLYGIDFKPPKRTQQYRLELLGEDEESVAGQRVNTYRYLLFPLQAGELELAFNAVMRKTTQASIENTVIGRDNVEELDFTATTVGLPKVTLEVQGQPTELVGVFQMTLAVSAEQVRAYEPVHVTLRIEGEGNLDRLQPFTLEIPGVQVFHEAPEKAFRLGEHGMKGAWVQRFALVSPTPFTLPPLTLEVFDRSVKEIRRLQMEAHSINVVAAYPPETLLEVAVEEDAPFMWRWAYLYYALTFGTGVMVGRWLRLRGRRVPRDRSLQGEIKKAQSLHELGVVLVLHGVKGCKELLTQIEGGELTLEAAKKRALKLTEY